MLSRPSLPRTVTLFAELKGSSKDFVPGYQFDLAEVRYWKDAISSFGGKRITQLLNQFANDIRSSQISQFGASDIPEDFSAEGKLLPIHALLILAMLHGFGHLQGSLNGQEGAFSTNNLLISPKPQGCLVGLDCNDYEEPVLTPQQGVLHLIDGALIQEVVKEQKGTEIVEVPYPTDLALRIIEDLTSATVPYANALADSIAGYTALDPIQYMSFGQVGRALETMLVSKASIFISKALFPDWNGDLSLMPYAAQLKLSPITESEWDVFNIYLSAWFNTNFATRWTSSLDKSNESLSNKGLSGLAMMGKLLGNFGLLRQIDGTLDLPSDFEKMTYNWLLLGITSLSESGCKDNTVFYEPLERCVLKLNGFNEGIRTAFAVLNMAPGLKAATESGDLGQLALSMLKNGIFAPYTLTKEAWAEVTLALENTRKQLMNTTINENTGLFAGSLDFGAWSVTSFVPDENEFSGTSPPPPDPHCGEGEVFKNGQCVVDAASGTKEEASPPKKKSFMGWILGGVAVLGAGFLWWKYEGSNKDDRK